VKKEMKFDRADEVTNLKPELVVTEYKLSCASREKKD